MKFNFFNTDEVMIEEGIRRLGKAPVRMKNKLEDIPDSLSGPVEQFGSLINF